MIVENLAVLRRKIEETCKRSSRKSEDVKLIAVSKYFGVDKIIEAKNCGLTDFGENRAQELTLKFEKLGNEVVWHFIGSLQKNKVRYAVKAAELIHSVDSLELLEEINQRAEKLDKVQNILLEVKTS
ncbi:MAG: alanine racemase, partial [Ignavibacterium sp.]|nr:alanine racemase [Ignavibacterium sp.]